MKVGWKVAAKVFVSVEWTVAYWVDLKVVQ